MTTLTSECISALKKRRYLIVESDIGLLNILEETFSKFDISYYGATNNNSALDIIDMIYIDCIIIDLNIPEINGLEICKNILNKYNKPVIMLSGTYDNMIVQAADKVGILSFLYKPLNLIDLFELLTRINYDMYKTPKKLTKNIV